jgi:nucleoside-triphosphatase THEP1
MFKLPSIIYNANMVHLVTGKKDEGKSTKLQELFEKTEGARGFLAKKITDCGRVTKYDLVDLKTRETFPLAKLTSLPIPEDWSDTVHLGPFTFNRKGFEQAGGILETAVRDGAKAFFIDELGKMELKGKGHADTIRSALKTGMDLYITVRDINVNDAIKAFGITEHTVIQAR